MARCARPSRSRPHKREQRSRRPRRLRACASRVSDIAAERHDPEIGAPAQQLGLAPQRRGADDRTLRQQGEARRRWPTGRRRAGRRAAARRRSQLRRAAGSPGLSANARRDRHAPARSAASISLANSPLPPISASRRSCTRSPVVRMATISTAPAAARPGWAAASRSRTSAGLAQRHRAAAGADAQRANGHLQFPRPPVLARWRAGSNTRRYHPGNIGRVRVSASQNDRESRATGARSECRRGHARQRSAAPPCGRRARRSAHWSGCRSAADCRRGSTAGPGRRARPAAPSAIICSSSIAAGTLPIALLVTTLNGASSARLSGSSR